MAAFDFNNISLSWKNLTVAPARSWFGKPHKPILDNISGHVTSGQLVAVMGTSGAGKTTLFNTLMYQNMNGLEVRSGHAYINGAPTKANTMRCLTGYMPQADILIGTLTVHEHLEFLATLKLGHMTKPEREARINWLLKQYGLAKCRDTLIGVRGQVKGISGGEMRRLSFVSELLSDPVLLLCDEPTTGLDSWMAENVVGQMRQMTREQGKTIMAVIHQPSSEVFKLFDSVLLISEGRVAFMGSVKEADLFFSSLGFTCPSSFNPADHYIHKLSRVPRHEDEYEARTSYICQQFQKSQYGQTQTGGIDVIEAQVNTKKEAVKILDDLEPYKSGWLLQFWACLQRAIRSILKEPILIRIRVIQNVIFALMVGTLYFGQEISQESIININGALFWSVLNQTFTTYGTILRVFAQELPIMFREHGQGYYKISSYYLARIVADMPLFLVTPTIFMSIYYWMVGFSDDPVKFAFTTATAILIVQVGISLGYCISAVSPNFEFALGIGPALTTPLMAFGGVYSNSDSISPATAWIKYISHFFYGNEIMESIQWGDIENIPCPDNSPVCINNGDEVMASQGLSKDNLAFDVAMMFVLLLAMRSIGYIALLIKAFIYRKES